MSTLRLSSEQEETENAHEEERQKGTHQEEQEDVCCLCLCGRDSEDAEDEDAEDSIDCNQPLLRYCEQCKCVLHADCMQKLVQRSRTGWVMFPTICAAASPPSKATLSTARPHTSCRHTDNRLEPRFVFVPQAIENIGQIAMHHRFLDLRRSMIDFLLGKMSVLSRWLPADDDEVDDRYVLAHRFCANAANSSAVGRHSVQEYIIGTGSSVPPLPKERLLDTPLLYKDKSACSLSIELLPDTRCISCRKPTRIHRDDDADSEYSGVTQSNNHSILIEMWAVFVLHAVLVSALSFWCVQSAQQWTGLPDFAVLALPMSSFLHLFWWSVLAGPVWHFRSDIWCRLIEIIVKQRTSNRWNAQQIVSLGQQLTQFGRKNSPGTEFVLLHDVRMLASANQTFLITSILPSTYLVNAVILQGLYCSRALWKGLLWDAETKERIFARRLSTTVDDGTGSIRVDSTLAIDEKFAQAATVRHRWTFYITGILVGAEFTQLFRGMSWRSLFVASAICGGVSFGNAFIWAVHALHITAELIRMCGFTYLAWIWIPNEMPNLTIDINPSPLTRRFVRPIE